MRDLDLTSLRLFVTVCDTGNMSRAAEKANMVTDSGLDPGTRAAALNGCYVETFRIGACGQ